MSINKSVLKNYPLSVEAKMFFIRGHITSLTIIVSHLENLGISLDRETVKDTNQVIMDDILNLLDKAVGGIENYDPSLTMLTNVCKVRAVGKLLIDKPLDEDLANYITSIFVETLLLNDIHFRLYFRTVEEAQAAMSKISPRARPTNDGIDEIYKVVDDSPIFDENMYLTLLDILDEAVDDRMGILTSILDGGNEDKIKVLSNSPMNSNPNTIH